MTLIILNIDGLKDEIFRTALPRTKFLKNFFTENSTLNSTFPSITFAAQCSITTGVHPETHGVPGNQFLDRLGIYSNGTPFFYALDYGKGLNARVPAKVFVEPGLGNKLISEDVETLYEYARKLGKTSLVLNHMYSRGAHYWLRPSLPELYFSKRFWKGFYNFQKWFDTRSLRRFIKHIKHSSLPDLSMLYLMGLDNVSHRLGVEFQEKYLLEVIDPLFGELLSTHKIARNIKNITFILLSDHGQMSFPSNDFEFKRIGGMKRKDNFFHGQLKSSNFNLKDCDLVFGSNASAGYLYVRKNGDSWSAEPSFSEVTEVAEKIYSESNGFISGVLLRDTENLGFQASYQALLPSGELTSVERLLEVQNIENFFGAERIFQSPGILSPDIVLLCDTSNGNCFGPNFKGNHGGLSSDESQCVFAMNRDFSQIEGVRDLTFVKTVVERFL